jgi:hypothetical protein
MNWDAVTALATAFTGIVIATTALIALREVRLGAEQVRATGEQLEHLRKTTQFEGSLEVFKELDSPTQIDARHYVLFELPEKLKDPAYRADVAKINSADERVHLELTVLRCFERIAYYERKGFVDRDTLLMVASGRVIVMWTALENIVLVHRASIGPGAWKNFEQLYHLTKLWLIEQGIDTGAREAILRDELGLDAAR